MKPIAALLISFMFLGTACAEAPGESLRPEARGDEVSQGAISSQSSVAGDRQRPFWQSLRPRKRSEDIQQAAVRQQADPARGMVCGDPDILGEKLGYVSGKLQGCGVSEAVRIRSIAGVSLSQGSIMDCTTAKAMKGWINAGLKPAVGNAGGGISQIKVVSHYSCRMRASGRKLSEHGKGRAVDIAGFSLRDGTQISVLRDWGSKAWGKVLKAMHSRACGPFGTVLGPAANAAHRDHFHFDTARYRSGSYCR